MNRILWNERGQDIDEIVLHNATVHIEQMHEREWWIGIDLPDGGYWSGFFVAKGQMQFVEQSREGFEWDEDDAHREAS